jgi:hypothetical protein
VEFHPSYTEIIALLDALVSRLCLMPSLEDVNLQTIQVILLYAQWMPCGQQYGTPSPTHKRPRSRYNDVSAYTILGLALRFAKVIGLEKHATCSFQQQNKSASTSDVDRLRVWNNLVTCHYNLMLNSRFDASVDPAPAAIASQKMILHLAAQNPEDTRVAALVELSVILYRAGRSTGSLSRLPLDGTSIRKANAEFDEWERSWRSRLAETDSWHNCMPFTSLRWYRLAMNSASLEPLLSVKEPSDSRPIQLWRLQSLETSLTAASQMLMALSTSAPDKIWDLDSQDTDSFPSGPFTEDLAACRRLSYAVDSTWISHTFAAAFLVLCYVRKVADGKIHSFLSSMGRILTYHRRSRHLRSGHSNFFTQLCTNATFPRLNHSQDHPTCNSNLRRRLPRRAFTPCAMFPVDCAQRCIIDSCEW